MGLFSKIFLIVNEASGSTDTSVEPDNSNNNNRLNVEQAINEGIDLYAEEGGLEILGAGSIKGGKTSYDVGEGFWFGNDDGYHKVAIGDPTANTINWDGLNIDAQMRNLELTGWLRGPAEFVIDPATHGNDTGTVVIAGNLQVDGTTTTVNSTVVEIDDIAVQLAAEATTATLANNGGILVGTYTNHPYILYRNSYDAWEVNKHWHPSTNNNKDLGGASAKWRDLYVGRNAYINGSLTVDGGTSLLGDIILGDQTSDTIYINAEIAGHLIPDVNNTGDLGSSTKRWRKLYANDGDFSDDLTVGGDLGVTGEVSGGSLDIGNGDFAVDASGNTSSNGSMTASSFSSPGGGLNVPGGSNNQILKHNGTKLVYENHVLSEINNVSTTTPTDNYVLKYNSGNSLWEPDQIDWSEILNKPTIPTNITQIDPGNLLHDLLGDLDGYTDPQGDVFIRMINANSTLRGKVEIAGGSGISVSESSDTITISSTQTVPTNITQIDPGNLLYNLLGDLDGWTDGSGDVYIRMVNANSMVKGQVEIAGGSGISVSESADTITISNTQTVPTNITQIDPGNLLHNLLGDLDGWTDPNTSEVYIRMVNANSMVKGQVELAAGTGISISESADTITISNTLSVPSQVQSNWNETNTSSAAFIQNKPTIPAAQVQSNWTETSSSNPAFIQNKPTIPTTISSLTDTTITSVQNGDILKYNSNTNKWENVRDSVVQYSVTPAPCGHYYIDIVEKGDVVTLQAALHIQQEYNQTQSAVWTSTIQAPSGGSVPQPGNTIAVGTAMTTGNTAGSYKTYVAQIDQNGIIKLVSTEPRTIIDTFTGDGSTTEFILSEEPRNKDENNTMVHVGGTYFTKGAYSVGINTTTFNKLTFSTAPNNGAAIEVITQSAPGFVTRQELRDSGSNFVFINITFVK